MDCNEIQASDLLLSNFTYIDLATCLKEEGLEVVGHVRDGDEEKGGDVHSEDGAQQSPGEYLHVQMNKLMSFSKNLPKTTSTSMLPPEARLMLVCLRNNGCEVATIARITKIARILRMLMMQIG